MNYRLLALFALSFTMVSFVSIKANLSPKCPNTDPKLVAEKVKMAMEVKCKIFYETINMNSFSLPKYECFLKAFQGYHQLEEQGVVQNSYLTIVDFSLPSSEERMWVINMKTKEIISLSLVAHGRNSGDLLPSTFSNKPESFQSSLGFYITGESYIGKHGLSMRLDGVEYGINDKARERAIVLHGADYVSHQFVNQNGRLGRSQGCPAIPNHLVNSLVPLLKDKSCLFIYHPSRAYALKSRLAS